MEVDDSCEVWCDADPGATRCHSVLLSCQSLPDKIMLGCITYPVGAFVAKPLLFQLQHLWSCQCVGGRFQDVEVCRRARERSVVSLDKVVNCRVHMLLGLKCSVASQSGVEC